jgi:hypothetical protein
MNLDLRKTLNRSHAVIGGLRVGSCAGGMKPCVFAVLPPAQAMRSGVIATL